MMGKISAPISFGALAAFVVGWGALCGYAHAPYLLNAFGALAAAAFSLWIARGVIEPPAGDRQAINWLVLPAYGFLALIALGIATVCYFFVIVKLHR